MIVTFFELLTQIFTLDFLGLFINSNIFRWLNHVEFGIIYECHSPILKGDIDFGKVGSSGKSKLKRVT